MHCIASWTPLKSSKNLQTLAWAQFGRGHEGRVLLTFSEGGNRICYVPPTFFTLDFVFKEVGKIKMTYAMFHVRCSEAELMLKRNLMWYH